MLNCIYTAQSSLKDTNESPMLFHYLIYYFDFLANISWSCYRIIILLKLIQINAHWFISWRFYISSSWHISHLSVSGYLRFTLEWILFHYVLSLLFKLLRSLLHFQKVWRFLLSWLLEWGLLYRRHLIHWNHILICLIFWCLRITWRNYVNWLIIIYVF